jgi:hypothetical protein
LSTQGFTYAHANPARYTDPTGEFLPFVVGAIAAVGGVTGCLYGALTNDDAEMSNWERCKAYGGLAAFGAAVAAATGGVVGSALGVEGVSGLAAGEILTAKGGALALTGAASAGAGGATTGAVAADDGERLTGALRGGLHAAGMGLTAPLIVAAGTAFGAAGVGVAAFGVDAADQGVGNLLRHQNGYDITRGAFALLGGAGMYKASPYLNRANSAVDTAVASALNRPSFFSASSVWRDIALKQIRTPGGGLDFSGTKAMHVNADGGETIVTIQYTGSRNGDYRAANAQAGFLGKRGLPTIDAHRQVAPGYTWHHVDDYNPVTNTGTMQLVRTNVHGVIDHVGGVKQYEVATGVEYQ